MRLRLVEEVRASGNPLLLQIRGVTVAILQPLPPVEKRREPAVPREIAEADVEAYRAAAGSWHDVDVDEFIADIYSSRDASISTKAIGER